jgi:predicted glycosyltransferase
VCPGVSIESGLITRENYREGRHGLVTSPSPVVRGTAPQRGVSAQKPPVFCYTGALRMRLLIEAHHPAHIHFWKNAVRIWRERGDAVLLLGRDRDVMRKLLAAYDYVPHEILTAQRKNNRFPMEEMLARQAKLGAKIASFRPDVVLSLMGSYTQSAFLFGLPNIVFTDSEFQSLNHRIAHPFATRIYTPSCFWKELGPKQRRYAGYHELAFLHPNRFTPKDDVLASMGNPEPHSYLILRMSAWNTLHDIGKKGFGDRFDDFMSKLAGRIRVFLVPEGGDLPQKWEPLRLRIPPERFHDALAFAQLVVTEGASTASEAACLGVPAVYLNTTERGYLNDQERKYGLVHNFKDPDLALSKTLELLAEGPRRAQNLAARDRLVEDHIDVTSYVVSEVDDVVKRTPKGFFKGRNQ